MKKFIGNQAGISAVVIIIAVVIVAAVITAISLFKFGKEETIKIGAILSISGPGGFYGKEVKDGMLLAAQEINSRGGINGREIELIIEDSKTNPEEGKKAFNKIESMHHPVLYVSTLSSVSVAVASLAEEQKVVLLGLVVATPKLTKEKEWVFRYWTTAKTEVKTIFPIIQEFKIKNLGIFYPNDEYGTSVFELLKKEHEKAGGIIKSEAFNVKTSDFNAHIAKLKDSDAIYSIGFDFHLKNLFRQLKKGNISGPIFSTNTATDASVRSLPGANGVFTTATIIYNPNYLYAREAKEKYEARYSKPFNPYAANGYDFMKLMAGLIEDKKVSRENMKSLLEEGFVYSGVFGSIDVKPGEHDITFPLHPAQIVDGKIKYLR